MTLKEVQARTDEVYALLGERLSIRGADLPTRVRRAGRALPRRVRREAKYLAEASTHAMNPKLAPMIDMARVNKAHRACVQHLRGIDVVRRRLDYTLGVLASVGLGILLLGGIGISYLVWRGYL